MNMPKVKLGIIAVSRDCFPMELSMRRRNAVVEAYQKRNGEIYECSVTVENELHMTKALQEVRGSVQSGTALKPIQRIKNFSCECTVFPNVFDLVSALEKGKHWFGQMKEVHGILKFIKKREQILLSPNIINIILY